jgi:hypothetical protein
MLTLIKNAFKKVKPVKQAQVKVRLKRDENGHPTEHEIKQTLRVLSGSYGRLDRNN